MRNRDAAGEVVEVLVAVLRAAELADDAVVARGGRAGRWGRALEADGTWAVADEVLDIRVVVAGTNQAGRADQGHAAVGVAHAAKACDLGEVRRWERDKSRGEVAHLDQEVLAWLDVPRQEDLVAGAVEAGDGNWPSVLHGPAVEVYDLGAAVV